MDYLIAFVVGGIICAFVQILVEKTKLMPGRIMLYLLLPEQFWELPEYMSLLQSGQKQEQPYPLPGLEICFIKV